MNSEGVGRLLFSALLFPLGLALAVVIGLPLAIILYPFLLLSEWSHAKIIARLLSESYETSCSSEEFSGHADVPSAIIRLIMLLPFMPVLLFGEELATSTLEIIEVTDRIYRSASQTLTRWRTRTR